MFASGHLNSACLIAVFLLRSPAGQANAAPRFDRDVKPILTAKCLPCHGPDHEARKADLRLDQREAALAAQAFVPGDAEHSELVRRIEHQDRKKRMPPARSGHVLSASECTTLRAWITAGAQYESHWAFTSPTRPALPDTAQDPWVRNPIDAFVLDGMRAHGLSPSPPTVPANLIRRVCLDLIGLPPSPEDSATFVGDPDADAYPRLLDRLFASPHFGEHMALPWLDAARYADSNGYQHDGDRQAWPWRDWLVRALNANRRFDELVVEMLAGDLLPQPTRDQRVATALQRHHPLNNEGGAIADEVRFQYVVDRVHTFSTMFLGLSIGCAQCHDHKFDPLSQREYYALFAFFDNVDEDGTVAVTRRNTYHEFQVSKPFLELADGEQLATVAKARADVNRAAAARRALEPALEKAFAAWLARGGTDSEEVPTTLADAVQRQGSVPWTDSERQRVRAAFALQVASDHRFAHAQRQLDAVQSVLARLHERTPLLMVMQERSERRPTRLHARGAYDQPVGEPIAPAVPGVLGALPDDAPHNRLGLARWLVSPANPLFARVLVNRIWQGFFGRGLVPTPEDFGAAGERPSHQKLLDWLACELIASGFDVQHVQRLIVTSATYRQSGASRDHHRELDPANVWLARSPRFRLSSLALRDQALAVAGLLDRTLGGPPVYPYQPAGLWLDVSFDVFDYPRAPAGDHHRRALYTFWRRTVAPPTLFDAADRQTCRVRPSRTNTPLHALVLLNDPTYVEAARALAQRVLVEGDDTDARLTRMFTLATARSPVAEELVVLRAALVRERERFAHQPSAANDLIAIGVLPAPRNIAPSELAAWTTVAQLVLNLDEVLNRA